MSSATCHARSAPQADLLASTDLWQQELLRPERAACLIQASWKGVQQRRYVALLKQVRMMLLLLLLLLVLLRFVVLLLVLQCSCCPSARY